MNVFPSFFPLLKYIHAFRKAIRLFRQLTFQSDAHYNNLSLIQSDLFGLAILYRKPIRGRKDVKSSSKSVSYGVYIGEDETKITYPLKLRALCQANPLMTLTYDRPDSPNRSFRNTVNTVLRQGTSVYNLLHGMLTNFLCDIVSLLSS